MVGGPLSVVCCQWSVAQRPSPPAPLPSRRIWQDRRHIFVRFSVERLLFYE